MLNLFYKMKIRSFVALVSTAIILFSNLGVSYAQGPSNSASIQHIEYQLAFPGLLPDSPIYKLKVLRDRISFYLISSPQKRIEFYLLQADKGILATAMLIDKNEIKLAEETALKAENNMTLITYEIKSISERPSNEVFEKLKTASLKHQEVLGMLVNRVPSGNTETLIRVINFSKTNLQTIEKLQNKKYYKKQ